LGMTCEKLARNYKDILDVLNNQLGLRVSFKALGALARSLLITGIDWSDGTYTALEELGTSHRLPETVALGA